jgi:ribonuclease HI
MMSYATSGKPHHALVARLVTALFDLAVTEPPRAVLDERVAETELVWRELRAAAAERQRQARLRAMSTGQWKRSIKNGYRSRVSRWTAHPAPLVAATDASRSGPRIGWGYVVSDGRWGLRHIRYAGRNPTGPAAVLVNELRAVFFLLSEIPQATKVRLLLDNNDAVAYLGRWREGDRTMPRGYDLRPRSRAPAPTLVLLADRVEQMPNLIVHEVRAHRGHPLNEAAHSLSVIARRADRAVRGYDSPEEMATMVDRFLTSWHESGPGQPVV